MLSEWITAFWLRMKSLFNRRQLDRDLGDELEFHLAMREQKLADEGTSVEEAHYAARRQLGNVTRTKETSREMWTFAFLETLWQDLRFGMRQLRRNPGFTAVAVITLALGIGANTAIFSVLNAVRLRLLPVREPARLVKLEQTFRGNAYDFFSYPTYLRLRDSNQAFSSLFGWAIQGMNLSLHGEVEPAEGMFVTGNYYSGLGVQALIGRNILPEDDREGELLRWRVCQ